MDITITESEVLPKNHKKWLNALKKTNKMLEDTIKNFVTIAMNNEKIYFESEIPLDRYNEMLHNKNLFFECDGYKFLIYDLHCSNFNSKDTDKLGHKPINSFWTTEEKEPNPFLKVKEDLSKDGYYIVDENWLNNQPNVVLYFEKPDDFSEDEENLIIYI